MTRTTQLAILLSILAVAARLILVDQPYIDNWSWRQSDVAAIARNFYENGFHFAYPQIDWAGDQPGYVGTEFPILPLVAAVCYKFLGVHEWIGRIQAAILFVVSLPFFFLLVREVFDPLAATWAIFFYSFAPLNLFAGREFMPDVPSLGLAIVGLYFFFRWMDNAKPAFFAASACTISLSILTKFSSAIIGVPLLYLIVAAPNAFGVAPKGNSSHDHRPPLQLLALFAAITLLPSAIWYWHAHQIAEMFYPHHFFGAGGIQIENLAWYWKIARLTTTSSLTLPLSVLAMIGLFVAPRGKYARLFHWWLAGMVVFIVIVGYGNRHQWYQLPLVAIAAALAGVACAVVAAKLSDRRAKIASSILLATLFGFLAFHYAQALYRPVAAQLRDAGMELKRTTPPNSLIVAADHGDPTIFYCAERKGWHFVETDGIYNGDPIDSRQAIDDLEELRARGASHLVFTSNTSWWLDYYTQFTAHLETAAKLVKRTPEFAIYQLEPEPH